ncbi:MAG: hypothetical protein V2B20_23620 [Pseudomonadota bacterium]
MAIRTTEAIICGFSQGGWVAIMELKSRITGLVFSVGIFAAKSGAGLSYLLLPITLQKYSRRLLQLC